MDLDTFFNDITPSEEQILEKDPPLVASGMDPLQQFIVLGDLHLGARGCSDVFHDHFAEFFREVFWPYIQKSKIRTIVQLGDFFDNRRQIDYRALQFLNDEIVRPSRELGVKWIVFPGNHDCYYKSTTKTNAIDLILKSYGPEVFTVVDRPQDIEVVPGFAGCMIPWICDENYEECLRVIERSKATHCFGHFEFSGYDMYRGMPCSEGMDDTSVKKFDQVFSGHFHTPSDGDPVIYVGTPYWITKSDAPDQKRFVVVNPDGSWESVVNPRNLYVKVKSTEDMKDLKGRIVILDKGADQELEEEIRNQSPADLIIEMSAEEDKELTSSESLFTSPLESVLEMTEDDRIRSKIVNLYNESLSGKVNEVA